MGVYRLGCDVGGTFTDLLLLEEETGNTWRSKVHSTPDDQSIGVKSGIDDVLSRIPNGSHVELAVVNHGTTIATNAILEQKGAKVALVVTEGYRDILQTRRSRVPGGLATWIIWKKPEPLAPLEMTIEAPGRISTDGKEVYPFDHQAFEERLESIAAYKPDAITVSLLNSFANAAHETEARKILSRRFPNIPISLSSEVHPELMEYERTITTVVNSYVEPRVSTYLRNLLETLKAKTKHLRILRSDGGLSSVSLASRFPVTLALSGPAGGVAGVVSVVANQTKYKNLITFDMGGTSTDVALIENGEPRIRRETAIADLVVRTPSIDVRTVGAGGGSIARVPEVTKALRVGPESAGAVPGPAAYGKGGKEATVTDANVVLGYLPGALLGGEFKLDIDAARNSVQKVADDLGVSLHEAAEGIIRLSTETMYGALRVVSVEQGFDPREFSLVGFGGAGPLHANALGKLLGAWPVIIPPSPGVLCAWGDATTLLRHEVTQTFIRVLNDTTEDAVTKAFGSLREQVAEVMVEEQGVPREKHVYKHQLDCRYHGQAVTIPVELDLGAFEKEGLALIRELFHAAHEKLYTYRLDSEVELMNLRIVAEETKPSFTIKGLTKASSQEPPKSAKASSTTLIYSGEEYEACAVWSRSELQCGHRIVGPCVVTEMDSNTLILPGHYADIDEVGNILIWQSKEADTEEKAKVTQKIDAATVDIFESALRNARDEMDTLMTHATMSPAIREQQDEFNVIAEPSGKMIVGQFGSFIGQFLEVWKGTIEPDDIFITNDPYSIDGAVSHLNDWLVLMPVFVNDKLIAWTSNFGHMTDNGGSVPVSLPTAGTSIFEEGIQIPLIKLASRGVWNQDLVKILYRNSRLPEWTRSDTLALVAACKLAGRRMTELYNRFGDKVYFEVIEELLSRNRKAISSIFETSIPDQPVYFEDWIDDDGRGVGPWKIACTMSKENGRLKFDFTGTDPQSASSVNFYLSGNMFKMFVGIYLIVIYDPNTVVNDGFHDLVDFYVPKGCILNPVRPAALSTRTHLLGRIFDLLSGLIGQRDPTFMTAGGFSDSPHFMYSGWKEDGEWFQLYQIGFGGIPARPHGDGIDGHCLWPAMKSVPMEFLELYYPLRMEAYHTVADSGGAGLYRGGNAQRIRYRFLEEGEISIHDDRWLSKPWGVLGGEPGRRGRKVLFRYSKSADAQGETLPAKCDHIRVLKEDVLEWETWGGGGYGDALKRDPDIVALEVARGLVTIEGAKKGYGVMVLPPSESNGKIHSVDLTESEKLRKEMQISKEEQANLKTTTDNDQDSEMEKHKVEVAGLDHIFNRGGTWAELKKNCKAETGLDPPKWPWEIPMRGPHTKLPYVRNWMEEHGMIKKEVKK